MKVLAAICCLVIGTSAQVGPSGIVNPDGTLVQFTAEQANNIASIGPSGIVTNDGRNIQLSAGKESFSASDIPTPIVKAAASLPDLRAGGLVGASGIVNEDGSIQFTREQAENIVVAGPSGVVTKDGRNIQFRTKRALVGPSGLLRADGTPVQFRAEEIAVRSGLTDEENLNAAVIGPSGIVNFDGKNTQLKAPDAPTVLLEGPSGKVMSDGSLIQKIAKRSAGYVSAAGNIGHSGILRADGSTDLFSHDFAHNIVLIGPSGIVTKDGTNAQLTSDLHRVKRSAGYVSQAGNIGHSGILRADGSTDLFSHDFAHNIVLIGPSGIVTKDGTNAQLTADLRRVKRSAGYVSAAGNIGHSGILRADGSTDLFSHDFAHNIVLIGPSGIVTKDGSNAQLTSDLRRV